NDGFFDAAFPTYEDGALVIASQTVWTGTSRVGTNTVNGCCTAPLGTNGPFAGVTGSANIFTTFVSTSDNNSNAHHLYAISSELSVPTPEPATFVLLP